MEGISPEDLTGIYTLLLGSGLDITAMNRIRKRFSRWGGGRLARALAPAPVRVYVVSDVIGDDLASIGSGPCVPDPTTAADVRASAREPPDSGSDCRSPLAGWSSRPNAGEIAETPKPGDQAFARVTLELIASNGLALEAAAKRAAELGLAPVVSDTPLAGEASAAGASVAATLLQDCARPRHPATGSRQRCFIWGGETTVTLGAAGPGLGGRCQELALAAARALLDGARAASLCSRRAPMAATGRPMPPARSWTGAPGGR